MFAGSCHDWRLRLVLQYRVQITRTRGKCWSYEPYAANVSFLLTEKTTFKYVIEMQTLYCFINLNQLYVEDILFGCFK